MTLVAAAFLALSQAPQAPPPTAALPAPAVQRQPRLIPLPDDALAYVPASAGARPPLLVLLHGAGRQRAAEMLQSFEFEADARGLVLLAPVSHGQTWDVVSKAEGPPSLDSFLVNTLAHRFSGSRDADRVEAVIAALGRIVPVDPARTVLAGFSDGATFALAMGMARRFPFAAVIAWSPGIAIETVGAARGRRVLVSHGRDDPVLKFAETCGEIVPLLQGEGAAVTFLSFAGGHEAPDWLKDTFLDAAFGARPGTEAHPLPRSVETCMPPLRGEPGLRPG